MATFREDPAAYMRARRTRLKAEAEQAVVSGDTRKLKGPEAQRARRRAVREAIMRVSDAEIATIRAKVAAIGPSAVMTKTPDPVGGKLRIDVITVDAFKARQKARSAAPVVAALAARPPTPPAIIPRPFLATGHTNRALTVPRAPLQGEVIPPPRSMIADGGSPPRRYPTGASVAEATAMIRAYAAQQARVNEDMAQRLATIEREQVETARRLAAIERRRTGIVAVVQGVASLFSLV